MAERARKLQVFVASPGDVQDARDRLARVIDQLNRGMAAEKGLVLELVRWETHSWPGVGSDIQDVINRELRAPDIFIGVFWKRFGTPTPRAGSGTEEEFERTFQIWQAQRSVEILFYFNQQPFYPESEDELAHVARILAFRRGLTERGVFSRSYSGVDEFERLVHDNLSQVLRRYAPPSLDRPDITGIWKGSGMDRYVEREGLPPGDLEVTMRIDARADPLTATASISSKLLAVATELVLTGTYYNDEYVQLMYRNEDRLRRQLGVAVLRLDPLGVTMTVHYAGYSPTRNTFVMGRLDLTRQNEAVAPSSTFGPGRLPV